MFSLNTKFCNIKNVNLHLCNVLNALDVLSLNSQSYEEGRILTEAWNRDWSCSESPELMIEMSSGSSSWFVPEPSQPQVMLQHDALRTVS